MFEVPIISVAQYQLIPKGVIGVREKAIGHGALLKFQWNSDRIGYADCFPWSELGDASLKEQLSDLKKGVITPLLERSIFFSKIDAEARRAGRSLWLDDCGKSLEIPKCHALVLHPDELSDLGLKKIVQNGFEILKLKISTDLLNEAHRIYSWIPFFREHGLRVRFDLNARCSFHQLSIFLNTLGPELEWIDFIEDPCPFEASTWALIQKRWGVKIALDQIPPGFRFETLLDQSSVSVFIVKPAIQNTEVLFQVADRLQMPVVVTSYLDHPLGQVCAAWVAAQRLRIRSSGLLQCGFVSHSAYEINSFSKCFGPWMPKLCLPHGTGFGFDELLASQKWESL